MKKFLLSILCCLLAVSGFAEEATLSFANTAQRTSFSTSQQVWEQNGITFTNNKSKSTSNVANYANPVRLYKSSQIIVECSLGNITQITFDCNTNDYAKTLNSSISGSSKSDDKVTVTLDGTSTSFTVASLGGQVRLDGLTVTYKKSEVPTPEILFNGKDESEGDFEFEESLRVTIGVADGTTAYYTLNGETPTDESTPYENPLIIKADVLLQVIAYDNDGNMSPVAKQSFKLASGEESSGAEGTATLVKNVGDLSIDAEVVIVANGSNVALSTKQNTNNRGQVEITKNGDNVVLNDGVQILTLKAGTAENSFAFFTGSGYLYAASSSSNHLKTQTLNNTNSSWDITIDANGVATIKAQGEYTRNWLRYNSTSSLFSCYASGQENVSIYKVNTASYEDYVLNVTKAGWATLYLGYAVTIPAEVKCYVISRIEGETVVLEQVEGTLPANTGVIVEALEGEYTFVPTKETATVSSNLDGTIKNEYITNEAYVLGLDENDKVGLYKAKMAGGVFLNNANKAYLPASAVSASAQGANGFKFRFETTGIEGVSAVKGEKVIFDLAGRKLNDMSAPGIYIVNGKKVMVK